MTSTSRCAYRVQLTPHETEAAAEYIAARETASALQEISGFAAVAPIGSACGILIVNQLRPL
jgi:hypothetical protein